MPDWHERKDMNFLQISLEKISFNPFFFFLDMFVQERRGGFELVTTASLNVIPADWAPYKIVSSVYKHLFKKKKKVCINN